MTSPTCPIEIIIQRSAELAVYLWPDRENIRYMSPNPLPHDLREFITGNKPALLVRLNTWDAKEAIRLQIAADGEVEKLRVPGSDPAIQEAAQECAEAGHRSDMAGVRKACAMVEARARELTNARTAQTANASQAA